ncbi:MAG: hypothetical protein A3F79_03090 [Chlamydiae bacterium RIFCSPLOWO2_12_FULL_45_20]|nr:MAG: hypothetical protein A2978_00490 [Chlamydiae bacterium RIFCSPLOWO2_01_FULL_44_52]OGN67659.1 MAG: hypothetical protein A3I67_04425 [Chlamydiae bacterium RIFCSPLOWO2_02_FULL_45_22]OGN71362.1 MAG: hypothetical protein A3F79_03090 [Chlamydiae bacterium RIFCSPLOWO2_12_FULL_45_20]
MSTVVIAVVGSFFPLVRNLLALSWIGLERFYLWQLATYIFVERSSFSFHFALSLAFDMYLLWIFGTSLLERARPKLFFILYFGAAIVGALSVLVFPRFVLAGSSNAVYALMVTWAMINPHSKLLLFFTLPFHSYVLVFAILSISLFFHVTSENWVAALSLVSSCFFAYLFALFTWHTTGPLSFFHSFERKLIRLFEKRRDKTHSNIYDIQSGKPLSDDDQFMDAMLDRISRHGESSLSSQERKRMQKISKKRKEV